MTSWISDSPESRALFAEEKLVLAATELICEAMDAAGVNKKGLADLLKVRPTEVSQRLNGKRNLTLRSLARMLHALGYDVELTLKRPAPRKADSADRAIGARVTKAMASPDRLNSPRVYRALLCAYLEGDITRDDRAVDEHVTEIWRELERLDHIRSVSITRESRNLLALSLDVAAVDTLQATNRSAAAIRTAVHAVGGHTPGWETAVEQILSQVKFEVAEVRAGADDQICPA